MYPMTIVPRGTILHRPTNMLQVTLERKKERQKEKDEHLLGRARHGLIDRESFENCIVLIAHH